MEIIKDFWAFLRERKKWWLLPLILVLLLVGALIMLTGGTAVAPFVYTLF
jgi:competence protein ComGC